MPVVTQQFTLDMQGDTQIENIQKTPVTFLTIPDSLRA